MLAKDLKDKKVKPVCPNCGASDLLIEAYVQWDIRQQQWAITELTENNICGSCGRDVPQPKWILEGEEEAAKRLRV